VRFVVAKSFARIHWNNLVNFGILPLTFAREEDYELFHQGEEWEIPEVRRRLEKGEPLFLRNVATGQEVPVRHQLTPRQIEMILDGGLLAHIRRRG